MDGANYNLPFSLYLLQPLMQNDQICESEAVESKYSDMMIGYTEIKSILSQ